MLEKYKIVPLAKFKVKHFVEIPTIHHDKAVPPLLDCLKSSSPLNVSPPWLLSLAVAPYLADDTKIISPLVPRGGGHYDMILPTKVCITFYTYLFNTSVDQPGYSLLPHNFIFKSPSNFFCLDLKISISVFLCSVKFYLHLTN